MVELDTDEVKKEVDKTFFSGSTYTAFNEIDTICKTNGLFIGLNINCVTFCL
jgi:hypothetical protein